MSLVRDDFCAPKWKFWLAKIFGRKIVCPAEEGNAKLVVYFFLGTWYVTDITDEVND